jgi:hypothetical protein
MKTLKCQNKKCSHEVPKGRSIFCSKICKDEDRKAISYPPVAKINNKNIIKDMNCGLCAKPLNISKGQICYWHGKCRTKGRNKRYKLLKQKLNGK